MDCYIYGAGHMYNRIIGNIRIQKEINVIGVITTDASLCETLDGYKRLKADMTDWGAADYVIIAVENWKPIHSIIKGYGVEDERIINGKVFALPYFELHEYLKMKSSRPSIISNTCLGGRIYKELGMEMLTPCINAICLDDEAYIDFLNNFEELTSIDMLPISPDAKHKYSGTYNREFFIPQGHLGGRITWSFPHEDVETAVTNWNKRRRRINYDNLPCLMIAFSDEGAHAFEELKLERKLCFYYKDLGLESVIYTPEWNDPNVQRKYDFNYVMYVHRYMTNIEGMGRVDWIKFLKGKKSCLRW